MKVGDLVKFKTPWKDDRVGLILGDVEDPGGDLLECFEVLWHDGSHADAVYGYYLVLMSKAGKK